MRTEQCTHSPVIALCVELGIEDVDIIVADVADQNSLEVMCSQTKVVIDVVGPVSEAPPTSITMRCIHSILYGIAGSAMQLFLSKTILSDYPYHVCNVRDMQSCVCVGVWVCVCVCV